MQHPVLSRPVDDFTEQELAFSQLLLAWYQQHRRALPWRAHPTAYSVWVAEIMLQQTRMDTAVPRWQQFLERFPSVQALAAATEYEVCEAWAGLGYYTRARNLHRAAGVIVQTHGGEFPRTAAQLQTLPGIGPYTAGAIASIAFGEPAPLVDGNVVRVLARVFGIAEPFVKRAGVTAFWQQAGRLVQAPKARATPGSFNQALMEFGSLQCVPRAPLCLLCPARSLCRANATGRVHALPVAVPKTAPTAMQVAFVLRKTARGVLLVRRPLEGLWAGQWEMPSAAGPQAKQALQARGFELGAPIATVAHVLSHRLVTANVYACAAARTPKAAPNEHRSFIADPLAWPVSKLAHKALSAALSVAVAPRLAPAKRKRAKAKLS